jgi:phospholipid/cholesterol/gamma-HCH transport system permease protein
LRPDVEIRRLDDAVQLRLIGAWQLGEVRPVAADIAHEIGTDPALRRLAYDVSDLTAWDSSLLLFLQDVDRITAQTSIVVDRSSLPPGVQRLEALATAVPPKEVEQAPRATALARLGEAARRFWESIGDYIEFLGEVTQAFGRLLVGKGQFRRADLVELTRQAGADALGIVSLVSFLLGLILAFVGSQQLRQFGATIYVADLVGVAMARDMAALMTAIVMAGRSGAAYAAQLGIMKSNQEIDALTTMGIRPIDYLVVPRMVALCSMLPLLVLYSIFLGIVGGAFAATTVMDVSWTEYWRQTAGAVNLSQVTGGVFKGTVYGALVAFAGCYQGMRAERSSTGVGAAATSAVVTGIVAIIAACGLFQVLFDVLGW